VISGALGFDIKEDVSHKARLIFGVVQFLYDPLFGRCYFRKLLVGFHVRYLLKFLDPIAFLHVQLLDLALLDLFAEIGQGEPEEAEISHPFPG
jgi:hypothetical protein